MRYIYYLKLYNLNWNLNLDVSSNFSTLVAVFMKINF